MWYGIHLYRRHECEKALINLEMSLKMGLSPYDEALSKEYISKCEEGKVDIR